MAVSVFVRVCFYAFDCDVCVQAVSWCVYEYKSASERVVPPLSAV